MTRFARCVAHVYAIVLRLYPRPFLNQFGNEMQSVFADAIADASRKGKREVLTVFLREVRDLPIALWREHTLHHGEAQMVGETNSSGWSEDSVSWREIMIGLYPFALGTLSLLSSYPLPPAVWKSSIWGQLLMAVVYLAPIVIILGIGWARQFPRWSYPYIGFVSYILIVVLSEPMRRLLMLRDIWAQILAVDIGLFLMFGCFVLVGHVWRPLRPLYEGVRRDWTLFSFGLYLVAGMFASGVDHDDYPVLTVALIAPSLIVSLGALAYLRGTTKIQRIFPMLIALALAASVRIIEDKPFYAETVAIIGIVVFLPALLEFLPHSEKSARVA